MKEVLDWVKRKKEEEKLNRLFAEDPMTPEKSSEDSSKSEDSESIDDDIERELQQYKDLLAKSMEQQLADKKKEINARKRKEKQSKEQLTDSLAVWLEDMQVQKDQEERRRERRKSRSKSTESFKREDNKEE